LPGATHTSDTARCHNASITRHTQSTSWLSLISWHGKTLPGTTHTSDTVGCHNAAITRHIHRTSWLSLISWHGKTLPGITHTSDTVRCHNASITHHIHMWHKENKRHRTETNKRHIFCCTAPGSARHNLLKNRLIR